VHGSVWIEAAHIRHRRPTNGLDVPVTSLNEISARTGSLRPAPARALLATVYATAGDRVGAERILSELLTRASEEYVGPTIISWVYANLDQPDRAFEWLRKAGAEHDCTLAFGISWPIYDRISGDARFHELVRSLRLG
jgi:hypothetical protein